MTRGTKIAALVLLLVTAMLCTSCILDEKVMDIVLRNSTCVQFEEYDEDANFGTPDTIDMAEEIDDTLEKANLSRSNIRVARFISGTYQSTYLEPPVGHDDWEFSGVITVERIDKGDRVATTLIEYTTESVLDAMPAPIVADVTPAGVDVLNDALADYIAGADPVLVFATDNELVGPVAPSELDPIDFDWEACLNIYVIVTRTLDVIDLFPPSD